jgi:hypothetical protein
VPEKQSVNGNEGSPLNGGINTYFWFLCPQFGNLIVTLQKNGWMRIFLCGSSSLKFF